MRAGNSLVVAPVKVERAGENRPRHDLLRRVETGMRRRHQWGRSDRDICGTNLFPQLRATALRRITL